MPLKVYPSFGKLKLSIKNKREGSLNEVLFYLWNTKLEASLKKWNRFDWQNEKEVLDLWLHV